MRSIDISIVVCTYNRDEILRHTLHRLLYQITDGRFTYEIIVVDNGSTDKTYDVVKDLSNDSPVHMKYVLEQKPGLANARNSGITESKGRWLLFFDDDLLAENSLLYEFYKVMEETDADCIGGRTLLKLPHDIQVSLGAGCRGMLGESDYGGITRILKGKEYPMDGNVIRKIQVFQSVGEFDTCMIRGGQDQDFTRRAVSAGFRMWYAPKAVAYHLVPEHRLKENYFKWASYRHGQSFAYMDKKQKGITVIILAGIARCGQTLLLTLPRLLVAQIKSNSGEILWRKCLLWRTMGYIRMLLFILAPKCFPQRSFVSYLEFRKERHKLGF